MKVLVAALAAFTLACASTQPETPEPAPAAAATPAQAPAAGLAIYEGTYALQGANRIVTLRVWLDSEGRLNGELVGSGQQTIFRQAAEEHTFMHATRDDIVFHFTIENGRATAATMRQGEREISGPRTS